MTKIPALLADVCAIGLFALLARIAHNSAALPLTWQGVLQTAWPFWVGVAIAWVFIVLARMCAHRIVPAGLTVWICAVVVGLIVWSLKHGQAPHWSFMLVASTMSALLVLGWRGAAHLAGRRKAN